jgi:hypothetical protein
VKLVWRRMPFVARRCLRAGFCGVVALTMAAGLTSPASARTPKVTRPGPPKGVVAQPIDHGGVISWIPPSSDGGSPVTGYSVTVGSGSGGATCTTTSATTCTVSGLMNGHLAHAKVRAINGVGISRAADSGKFVPGRSPNCANLTPGANLQYCNLTKANLEGLNLAGADFWGAKLVDQNFGGADLAGALFGGDTQTQSDLTGVDFSNANLTGALLDGTYLYTVSFNGADLTDAGLSGATLIFVDFSGANLTGSDLVQADVLRFLTWSNTTCPDGSNSNNDGGSCPI